MAFDEEAFEEAGFWTKIVAAIAKLTGITQRKIKFKKQRKMTVTLKLRESDINISVKLRE